jgi:hypothetical protein
MATSVVLYMGPIGLYALLGIGLGIVLIVLWITRVKNMTALFYDKRKIRATLFLGVPGLIFLLLGLYYRFIYIPSYFDELSYLDDTTYNAEDYVPTLAYIHFVNKSPKPGRIQIGEQTEEVAAGDWKKINVQSKKDSDSLRAWLGDSLVLDTIITKGTYIGNFSDDITAVAEEVMYTSSTYTSTEDLKYIMLTGPGIEKFAFDLDYDVYGYDSDAPASITMYDNMTVKRSWDLKLLTADELVEMYLEALKEAGGDMESLEAEE